MKVPSHFSVLAMMASLVSPGSAAVSLDASGAQDTVMKVVYTGGSPSGSAPVLTVAGKTQGMYSVANSGTGARGIRGVISGMTEPGLSYPTGVAGGGGVGVAGYGSYAGVQGETNGYEGVALLGLSTGTAGVGVVGSGDIGVWAVSSTLAGYFSGDVVVTGDCDPCSPSDLRFKKNIREYHGGLDKVMALKPKAYEMRVEEFEGRVSLPKNPRVGLIAQDVESVLPDIVHEVDLPVRDFDGGEASKGRGSREKFKAINYTNLIPIMLTAIQEQQVEIEGLRETVARLQRK